MMKRPSTLITMNSERKYTISDEMRDLVVRYMEACNAGNKVEEAQLLAQIKEQGVIDYGDQD